MEELALHRSAARRSSRRSHLYPAETMSCRQFVAREKSTNLAAYLLVLLVLVWFQDPASRNVEARVSRSISEQMDIDRGSIPAAADPGAEKPHPSLPPSHAPEPTSGMPTTIHNDTNVTVSPTMSPTSINHTLSPTLNHTLSPTAAPTNSSNITHSPTLSPTLSPTHHPSLAPTTLSPATAAPASSAPSPSPTAMETKLVPHHHKRESLARILGRSLAWLIVLGLSVLAFGFVMQHRYRIYFFLRGVYYSILSLECSQYLNRTLHLREVFLVIGHYSRMLWNATGARVVAFVQERGWFGRGGGGGVDGSLNTIIFDNELSEGLLMREND
jgi:hypothetical protein